ncbi:hypothetical protein ACFU8W_51795, partial [Streptomyces sp. NPDC057565]
TSTSADATASAEWSTSTDMPPDLHGRVFGTFSIANTRPLRPLPTPIANPDEIAPLDIRRRERLGGILNEYQHAA